MGSMPPPYTPSAPKKTNTALIVAIILGGFGICCIGGLAVTGYAGCMAIKTGGPLVACGVGFEMTREAVAAYAKANNGMLPKAATWEDDVRSHFGTIPPDAKQALDFMQIQPMPKEGPWGCTQPDGPMTGIAFNDAVAGKKLAEVGDDEVLVFEVANAGRNLHEPYKDRPANSGPNITKGQRRDWFVAPARGDLKMGKSTKFEFNSKSGPGSQ